MGRHRVAGAALLAAALAPLVVRDAYLLDSLVLILLWGALSAAWNVAGGYAGQVSLGHSAATYEQALAGIAAGARHATHLFNRMTPMTHRAPGLTGAVISEEAVAASPLRR